MTSECISWSSQIGNCINQGWYSILRVTSRAEKGSAHRLHIDYEIHLMGPIDGNKSDYARIMEIIESLATKS